MRFPLAALMALSPFRAHAGKLDLDLYSELKSPPDLSAPARRSFDAWRPGDPRDLRGESPAVQYLSHGGYAAIGIGGLLASVATGGVAPAVGFGIVTLYQLWSASRVKSRPASDARRDQGLGR